MHFFLREGLHAAAYGRDLVLLDVGVGRYDLLAGAGEVAQLAATGRSLCTNDFMLIERFREADLLSPAAPLDLPADIPQLPVDSVLGEAQLRPSFVETLAFTWAWREMAVHYYGRALPYLLSRASRPALAKPKARFEFNLQRTAAVFNQLSPWAPFPGECVFRCFMLLRHLQRRGIGNIRWVFGVRTWPFYAHCWLQYEDVALTDHAEPLASFSPIYAL